MLLCGIADIEPGMISGASVVHPSRPDAELLRPGVTLDASIIKGLRKFNITQLWIRHDATADLDAAVAAGLTRAQEAVYHRLRDDFGKMSAQTISTARAQSYRQTIVELVCEVIGSRQFARLGERMVDGQGAMFGHCSAVAYLSVLAGLELETYVVQQRPRLSATEARNLVGLGMGAMFHDIGKLQISTHLHSYHEIHADPDRPLHPAEYDTHPAIGYRMLADARILPSAHQVVLNHHQRFDGKGWPDMSDVTQNRQSGVLAGTDIHIFSRIVAAANVLDNLISTADGKSRPPVAAIRDFAGARFDGWFDPTVRHLMVRRIPPFAVGSLVKLSDGRKAVVIAPSLDEPCRPCIRFLNENAKESAKPVLLNLRSAAPDLRIVECAGQNVEPYLFDLRQELTTYKPVAPPNTGAHQAPGTAAA